MIKTLTNLRKQEKEKFVVPKGVQDVIPITAIYDDGIFQMGKDKFSKTYKFSDINYAVASREDKESMFLEYSELLNSLDSGAMTKITINNRRLNRLDFENNILIPMKGDRLDEYREEYNKILLEKATGANAIVQDNPNYYLKRGFDKEYSSYGCPYVQENCDVLKPSDNVVIYGHHMNNGSMFADLEKFKDEDFWREHKTIAFNTLTEKNEYEILAVFKTVVYTDSPEAFKYYRFTDAQSPEEFDAYIEKCKELSLYDTGVSAEYGDKLITLSTCEYSRTNGRLVVVAKKVTESSGANAPANDGAAEIPS